MLESTYKHFRQKAEQINWKDYSNSDLFFNCIKHEHEPEYENWLAALQCRYWGHIGRMYTQCQRHVPIEDCFDTIYEAIVYTLEKRVWENPNSSIYNDPKGPDKAMHMAIKRQKNVLLSKYNAYRRQSNFNTLSLDNFKEDYNDAGEGWLRDSKKGEQEDALFYFVSSYFKGESYLEGIILDAICYSNNRTYDKKQVVSYIRDVSLKDYNYYKEDYGADRTIFIKTLNDISGMSSKYLNVQLKKLLYNLRTKEFNNYD